LLLGGFVGKPSACRAGGVDSPIANGTGNPGGTGAHAFGLSGGPVIDGRGERIGVIRHTVRRCARRAMLDSLNLGDELRTSYAAVT